jgi:arylsulfatase A-like enzyme
MVEPSTASGRSRRPNILLITTDTSRCDTLACYAPSTGYRHAISPHLDRLAGEGVVFDQAHTPAPVCMPARCSLLTGVHTPIHGSIENGVARHTHLTTFPDLLAGQGYSNVVVGKTHFGPVPPSFHVQHVLQGGKESAGDDFYTRHLRAHGYARVSRHPNPIPEEHFLETLLVDTTIQEIERHLATAPERPFFAFCSMISPHGPLDPPGAWAEAYAGRPLPSLNYVPGETAHHPRHLRELVGLEDSSDRLPVLPDGKPDLDAIDAHRRLYYGLAAYCDAQIGRLLAYLDGRDLRERTLVIFTSDHGVTLYDHGFHNKHHFYDEAWRVPLILSQPGTLPQGERRDFAIWNDLTATILAAAGTSCPSVQGFDLYHPLLRGESSPRRCAVSVLYRAMALATRRWKLEYYPEEQRGRLFDRLADPQEQTDLYARRSYREVRDPLLQALLSWRAELIDVEWLQANTTGNAKVAGRAAAHTHAMRGVDAEQRLNEAVAALDQG